MWSGRDSGVMYTIRQSGGAKFYVTRAIDRSYFASTRSLALAKVMAQDDAAEHVKKQKFKSNDTQIQNRSDGKLLRRRARSPRKWWSLFGYRLPPRKRWPAHV